MPAFRTLSLEPSLGTPSGHRKEKNPSLGTLKKQRNGVDFQDKKDNRQYSWGRHVTAVTRFQILPLNSLQRRTCVDRVVSRMDTPKCGDTLKFIYIKYQPILVVSPKVYQVWLWCNRNNLWKLNISSQRLDLITRDQWPALRPNH